MTCPTEEEGPAKVAGTGWLRWLETRWSHQVWEAEKEPPEPQQEEGRRLRRRSWSWTWLWNDTQVQLDTAWEPQQAPPGLGARE